VKPYYDHAGITLYHGDCLNVLATLPAESVDSIVTDPPYGLSFMGKKWDYDVPSVEIWEQCLRVLKPGGHLLAFAGTRTQHRMAVRIEDAGFEIRDMIAWVYGSGFPKSLDVSKAIDKAAGAEREVVGVSSVTGNRVSPTWKDGSGLQGNTNLLTAPSTEAAKQWAGWGTALKPSLEPITVARKPLRGTVAANVLQYGTGGLNVDGCRVGMEERPRLEAGFVRNGRTDEEVFATGYGRPKEINGTVSGRWPANIIHDGSDEVVGLFPDRKTTWVSPSHANNRSGDFLGELKHPGQQGFNDTGSAARFFYTAKADASERRDSKHPTVKPVALMRYLVRLVTPIGATVIDPFCGSGTTLEAAMLESCKAIGIEMNPEYCGDAVERLRQGVLF
jgi:site-specific DNA-methyltransferase (adenine-specific)